MGVVEVGLRKYLWPDSAPNAHDEQRRGRADADLASAREILRAWMDVRLGCLQLDGDELRAGGRFTNRLPPETAILMRQTDQDLKLVTQRLPASVRAPIASLFAAAEAMFEEQAADPEVVNESWLDTQVAELRGLYARAEAMLPDWPHGTLGTPESTPERPQERNMEPIAPLPDDSSPDTEVNSQNVHDTDAEGDGHAVEGNEAWARRLDALD